MVVTVRVGQTLGNYRVLEELGSGGMGMVYLAEHPLIGKRVALKVVHAELGADHEVMARFRNEARAVSKIGNEHIVALHDFGMSPDGDCYFIMEYLNGQTLEAELSRRPFLDPERVAFIGAQVASGLAAAHAAGIIHRDLKPDNIMLVARGTTTDFVKILDFGLAKLLDDAATRNLTGQGILLGTPQYMSPEAAKGERVDARSDIYALGILLYQLLCGRTPFVGGTSGEILVKHISHAVPPLGTFNATVPPAIERVVLRCLVKEPAGRFQSMHDVRSALLDLETYQEPADLSSRATRGLFSTPNVVESPEPAPSPTIAAAPTVIDLHPPEPEAPTASRVPFPEVPSEVAQPSRAPVVVGLFVIGVIIGLVIVVLWRGRTAEWPVAEADRAPVSVLDAAPADAEAAAQTAVAQTAAAQTAATAPTVTIEVTSDPTGAEVTSPSGMILGTTPFSMAVERGNDERALVFRHPDAVERTKLYRPTANMAVEVVLRPKSPAPEAGPVPKVRPRPTANPRPRRRPRQDDVLRPTF